MRRVLSFVPLLAALSASFTFGSPIANDAVVTTKWESPQTHQKTVKFRGGERACVIAVGLRRRDGGVIQISVHDARDETLVAEDKGSGLTGDCVAVMWYPPRDGDYRITVSSPNTGGPACYITVK